MRTRILVSTFLTYKSLTKGRELETLSCQAMHQIRSESAVNWRSTQHLRWGSRTTVHQDGRRCAPRRPILLILNSMILKRLTRWSLSRGATAPDSHASRWSLKGRVTTASRGRSTSRSRIRFKLLEEPASDHAVPNRAPQAGMATRNRFRALAAVRVRPAHPATRWQK